jgi:hypothetical protein
MCRADNGDAQQPSLHVAYRHLLLESIVRTSPFCSQERTADCPCTGTGTSENDESAFVRDVRARINCQDDVGGVSTFDKGQARVEGSWEK